jgi:hypothetical protein
MPLRPPPSTPSGSPPSGSESRYERQLRDGDPELVALIGSVPRQERPPLDPEWLRVEMLERAQLIRQAPLPAGLRVVEVGAGPHAIATLPLALRLGPRGRLVAVERTRWGRFGSLVAASGLAARIRPVRADARSLPLRNDAVDLAVCLHGLRSLGGEATTVAVFAEMLRVAPRLFLAESLPLARTPAQRAHLEMYGLRAELFQAISGRPDDLPYLPLERVGELAERAGRTVERSATLEVDLPHALAYFPREMIDSVPDPAVRQSLAVRWDAANAHLERYGADHPPVGVLEVRRSRG